MNPFTATLIAGFFIYRLVKITAPAPSNYELAGVDFVPSPFDVAPVEAAPTAELPKEKSTVDDRVKLVNSETNTFSFVGSKEAQNAVKGDGNELDELDWGQLKLKFKEPNRTLCEAVKKGRALGETLADIAKRQEVSLSTVKSISAALSKAEFFRATAVQ